MKIIQTVAEMRKELKKQTGTIGFVPTMGYLHEGHLSLVERARKENDVVVLSIFVNPLQFGPNEDYDRYPRDLDRDAGLAEKAGVDFIFHPDVREMYPETPLTQVNVTQITERLCGKSRPGHFAGVATVVSKLFHIIQPDRAYFGLKDAQQVAVIEQMVRDLHFPVTIVPCPIVREEDGLAMSSRNVYLSPEEREQALVISQALQQAKERVEKGELVEARDVIRFISERIETRPLARIEYVEAVSYPKLEPVERLDRPPVLVAVAVHFGKTRLIDNFLYEGKGE
ncbi:pantoate--beta-alanine ligase [Thermoactinomyces intermedius]|jgi:pantoate--beta-alanine ligase|uniref:Pantothenate synthetase n=1 Tax=Thermoactinomyces intermedius TaxID=2024 RepID=A0A8I1DFB2_THEIN|nr:pantoate--beta-alanine ligase [Thermoactinomyces intermedius]MBA4549003.1 pantoate--beta-alanine ligase [Thermoactinomyces intermedius]MBA4835436.1 pantoate--beta-alanine ligase [Thermoactinomyces intermedius]MBH8595410.1 pantoate--beta-alanine ligase [Thermoactinomyces intermedius]